MRERDRSGPTPAVAADHIRASVPLNPRVGIILGSGLAGLAGEVSESTEIPFERIPGFPQTTAPGHAGTMSIGRLGSCPVVVMAGRVHLYEGYSAAQVAFPVRVLAKLGVETLVITNAAGGVNPAFRPGTVMLIKDHINLTGTNPLIGLNGASAAPRFPDMTHAYDVHLQNLARDIARRQELTLAEGIYLGLLGPNYETPAEIRMAHALGADAVGMSTVIEVIAARHEGIKVLGVSCIANLASGLAPGPLNEDDVIETIGGIRGKIGLLVRGIVDALQVEA